jgi:ABC-2 type transport system permease protein
VSTATRRGSVALEVAKLRAQLRVRIALGGCLIAPFVLVLALHLQSSVPADTLFGRWVHESGYATPLVILGFAGQWALPLLISIVAGDIFAAEDQHGTWGTVLTRSASRDDLMTGKLVATAAYTVSVVLAIAAGSTAAGLLGFGSHPLVDLSGHLMPGGTAFGSVVASWATVIAPALAVAALGVLASVVSRNGWVGVVTPVLVLLLCQLVSLLSAVDPIRVFLPSSGFEAWHGLLRAEPSLHATWNALAVSVLWTAGAIGATVVVFRRRDVVDA